MAEMRKFDTGATRNTDTSKHDYEAFLSPLVIESFGAYMHKNRKQADGTLRDGDNWQKGIPKDAYMKSMWRHFFDVWKEHRGHKTPAGIVEDLNALLFNAQGMLHEILKETNDNTVPTQRDAKLHRRVEVRPVVGRAEPEGDFS